jgi:hypothetical protein
MSNWYLNFILDSSGGDYYEYTLVWVVTPCSSERVRRSKEHSASLRCISLKGTAVSKVQGITRKTGLVNWYFYPENRRCSAEVTGSLQTTVWSHFFCSSLNSFQWTFFNHSLLLNETIIWTYKLKMKVCYINKPICFPGTICYRLTSHIMY